jgi:predicted phage-related endonuclease
VAASKGMSPMTRDDAKRFVDSELAAIQATIENLLGRYVRPGSALEGHLQHAGNRIDIAQGVVGEKGSLRTKVRSRYE